MSRLWNLETLDLSHCDKLKELPRDIRKMMNLGHLINKKCDSLCGMPYGIGCLTNLQTLSIFVASQRNSKHSGIEELKGLNNLRGKLKIKNLKYEETGKLANLERKPYLWSLILDWGKSANGEVQKTDENVLEALKPHPNLKKFNISLFTGVKLCNWLSSLTKLTSISIKECKRCQCIPPLDQLPHLRSLSLAYLDVVEYISEEASTSYSTFFPSLKELAIYHCPKLKGWWRRDADNGAELPSFHCLSKLDIQTCPNLTFMPLYPSLEELKLSETSSKPLQQTMMLMNRVSATLSNLKSMHMFKIPDVESLSVEMMQKLTSLVDLKILLCPRLTDQMEQAIKFLPALQNLIIKPIEEHDPDWKNLRLEVIPRIAEYSHYAEKNSASTG
ncbi:hypothetical protein Pint_07308 [Pistacia integerrima]|uniref:Uncharacterized protein n=1 Tax=Pistacia integerrima TaxID=434235 RepID=A0ACC0XXM5_9ROSI|nr:hypothetical protein Pint_07308 [Pistacia integerrima]